MHSALVSLAAAALLSAATPVAAQDAMRIRYGDLNLSDLSGAVAFDSRVANAVKDACRREPRLVNSACVLRSQREAVSLLPQSRQEDYARARSGNERLIVRTPTGPAQP